VNVGSLFAGIGGFDLGLERAGMQVAWQVELDPYCRAVLAQHFPQAQRYEDVCEVSAENLPPVDLICGGFPCQDLSAAGKGAGLAGARSGLWSEFARIVREIRPRYVVVENVPALLTGKGKRWDRAPVGRVLGDLAEAGYDAEWACLSAREFGAPHLRKRVWIVAYPQEVGQPGRGEEPQAGGPQRGRPLVGAGVGAGGGAERRHPAEGGRVAGGDRVSSGPSALAHPARNAEAGPASAAGAERERAGPGGAQGGAGELSDADRDRCPQGVCLGAGAAEPSRSADALGRCQLADVADAEGNPERAGLCPSRAPRQRRRRPADCGGARGDVADPERGGREGRSDQPGRGDPERAAAVRCQGAADPARGGEARGPGRRLPASEGWGTEPNVGRVADGVPARVDRLAALGNALLPQIAEWIGCRILEYERGAASAEEPVI
jgi:site-specific DNA-cytosine methylase